MVNVLITLLFSKYIKIALYYNIDHRPHRVRKSYFPVW